MKPLTGQSIAVLGAGRSGLGAARLARLLGADVTVFDEGDPVKLAAAIGKLEEENLRVVCGDTAKALQVSAGDFDLVVISPGLDEHWPLPAKFTSAGIPLVGETEFAFQHTDMEMVAITGTNGKTTCTEAVAAIFNGCGLRSVPCGNHGVSLSEIVASGERYDVLALEVSSFQLETIRTFRARAGIWLNFAPDHLDRYPGIDAYFAAKARIFLNVGPKDTAIVRAGEKVSPGEAARRTFSTEPGIAADLTYASGEIRRGGEVVGRTGELKLRGRHNMENILAALLAGEAFGLSMPDMMNALRDFVPPAHRCELVRVLEDREYINDSKATNLHALEACLLSQDRPIVLIAGGKDKELDYTPLRPALGGRVRAMVFIGEIAGQLESTFGDLVPCKRASDMADAVCKARAASRAGDAVILSPGTSSFDMYSGYGARGQAFRDAVHGLN